VKKPNVVLFVLDTLRKDYSSGLDELQSLGFVKYDNAVSCAPWTLPSHVSMFTGLLPSQHQIHEDKQVSVIDLIHLSRNRMNKLGQGILGELKNDGYNTYGLSANPLINEDSGFSFNEFWRYHEPITYCFNKVEYRHFSKLSQNGINLQLVLRLLKEGRIKLALNIIARHNRYTNSHRELVFGEYPLEKGSKPFLSLIRKIDLREPFLLFINIMEAHEPYFWNETCFEADFLSAVGDTEGLHRWLKKFPVQKRYPLHSKLGVQRLIKMIHTLKHFLDDSLIIVTSDHGQLLGERGRYGHGYFLDDELLKVPLLVKYPVGARILKDDSLPISLTQIPSIIRHYVYGDDVRLGSKYVFSESFGLQNDLFGFAKNNESVEKLNSCYRHKLKVYSQAGTATINCNNDLIEELIGNLSTEQLRDIISLVT